MLASGSNEKGRSPASGLARGQSRPASCRLPVSALRFAVGPGLALGSAGVTVAGEKLSVPGSQSGTGQARMMPAFIFQSNQALPPPGEGSPRTGGARGRGGLAGAARPLSPLLLLFDFHTCCFRDVSFWGCAGLTAKSGGKSRASTQSPALTQTPPPTSRTSPASVTRPADPCGHAAGPRMA